MASNEQREESSGCALGEQEEQNSSYPGEAEVSYKESGEQTETPEEIRSRYRFVCPIGHGSQGNVFKAVRCSDGQVVAIKVLSIDSVQNWKDYELFHRESEVLQSLNMKGIAKFYESLEFLEQKHPRAYIVQEYIEGRSLEEMIQSGYRFTVNRVFEIALELLTLLEKLHRHDPPVIHRDLKPANIMCRRSTERDYDVYLIDFGAVANPKVQGGGSTIAGTCGYMPPEQLMGRPEASSDIYALGATLVYMLSGADPGEIQVKDFRLIIEPYLEQIPPGIVNVLRQMIDPAADKRLCDYVKLRECFANFAKGRYQYELSSAVKPGDVEKVINDVKYYTQPGNIDIWAALDDHVPRRLPFNLSKLHQTKLLSEHFVKKKADNRMANIVVLVFSMVMILFAIIVGILGSIYAICLGFMAIPPIIWMCVENRRNQSGISDFGGKAKVDLANITRILRYGRKGIGIITSVHYVPNDHRIMTDYYVNGNQWLYYGGLPSFRLKYKFNPIDDASPDDLVHDIIIHDEPVEGLEPGNPISILYYIDPEDNHYVSSLPYPFPLDKIVSLRDIYYNG